MLADADVDVDMPPLQGTADLSAYKESAAVSSTPIDLLPLTACRIVVSGGYCCPQCGVSRRIRLVWDARIVLPRPFPAELRSTNRLSERNEEIEHVRVRTIGLPDQAVRIMPQSSPKGCSELPAASFPGRRSMRTRPSPGLGPSATRLRASIRWKVPFGSNDRIRCP